LVSQHKFSELLKGFGQIQDSLKNAKSVLGSKWFYGFLTRIETDLLLRDQPVGTFLIRFSSSQPGIPVLLSHSILISLNFNLILIIFYSIVLSITEFNLI